MDSNDDDDFWSIALEPSVALRSAANYARDDSENDDEDGEISAVQPFTILPPSPSEEPLILNMQMNCNDGVLSDVSGIPWDAALLLSGFLYGTPQGRRLCYDACFGKNDKMSGGDGGGGILELGSGLGICGLAAAAAASSVQSNVQDEGCFIKDNCNDNNNRSISQSKKKNGGTAKGRVVLTDRDDAEIVSHLRKNVDSNRGVIAEASASQQNDLSITVEACDWMVISDALRSDSRRQLSNPQRPSGPYNLIIGSALVYTPQLGAACADTVFYYLTRDYHLNDTVLMQNRQAVIVQLPDRAGFATHFLPRCHELGLEVSCTELDGELVERVQQGLNRRIPSASDYRLYTIKDAPR